MASSLGKRGSLVLKPVKPVRVCPVSSLTLLAVAASVALILLLALKLRGPRGARDLMRPPKPKRKRLTPDDASKLQTLVAEGKEDEALHLVRGLGYEEAAARKLIAFIARLAARTP
jgi:hypothetical protein